MAAGRERVGKSGVPIPVGIKGKSSSAGCWPSVVALLHMALSALKLAFPALFGPSHPDHHYSPLCLSPAVCCLKVEGKGKQ